jgi:TatD DNase family protein
MHCHVDLFPDPQKLVRAIERSQTHTVAVTNAPSVFQYTEGLAKGCTYVHPALGLHPELVASHGHELDLMWPLLARTRFIGEVGLDYCTSDKGIRARQRTIFTQILERCGATGDKIITVHSRRAVADVLAAIGSRFPGRVIMHWFTGSAGELARASSADLYFSVNHAMLHSPKGRALVAAMPRNRVLIESDGPFVQIAGSAASPESAPATLRGLATLWGVDADAARATILGNYAELTNTPRPLP